MIDIQYINEGVRIRKKYLENIIKIAEKEPIIEHRKKEFYKIHDEMELIVKSDINNFKKTVELNGKLILLDREISQVQEIIKPYLEAIEKLNKEKDVLYEAIKEKYPNISDKTIEKEIMEHIKN